MADKILLRRGNKADTPILQPGEPGFALDTKELLIGATGGNVLQWGNGNNPASLGTNGYQKLANGFLVQWGTAALGANETRTIPFPVAFSSPPQVVGEAMDFPSGVSIKDSGFSATQFSVTNSIGGNVRFRWIAVGYVQ